VLRERKARSSRPLQPNESKEGRLAGLFFILRRVKKKDVEKLITPRLRVRHPTAKGERLPTVLTWFGMILETLWEKKGPEEGEDSLFVLGLGSGMWEKGTDKKGRKESKTNMDF